MKTEIPVFPWAKIGQNDHSNPYIESTTVLSDNYTFVVVYHEKFSSSPSKFMLKIVIIILCPIKIMIIHE